MPLIPMVFISLGWKRLTNGYWFKYRIYSQKINALQWQQNFKKKYCRFYSLWDTGYAKIHIPIIASVSEHQPTTWFSFFFDLHILACVFPVGLWYCIKNINDERVFIVLYAVSAVYFAGVMVRLMLTLTPCVCVLAAIAFSKLFELYLKDEEPPKAVTESAAKSESEDDKNGKLYDRAGKIRKIKHDKTEVIWVPFLHFTFW